MENEYSLHNQKKKKSEENENGEKSRDVGDGYMGVPVHSQVIKIKKEIEKIRYPSLQQLEIMRPVNFLQGFTRQRSPSPLGLAHERPISVGNA